MSIKRIFVGRILLRRIGKVGRIRVSRDGGEAETKD